MWMWLILLPCRAQESWGCQDLDGSREVAQDRIGAWNDGTGRAGGGQVSRAGVPALERARRSQRSIPSLRLGRRKCRKGRGVPEG